MISQFPDVNGYGNYTSNQPLPEGIARIAKDGSIRKIKKLGIPFVPIVEVINGYGKHYFASVVAYAIPVDRLADLTREVSKPIKTPKPLTSAEDLLICVREASRAAHRERDAAQQAYRQGRYFLATNSKNRKAEWYAWKEKGIIHLHKLGVLSYKGEVSQSMALYESVDGMVSLHSTLHPVMNIRPKVENHPETLFVPAKDKKKGLSELRIAISLENLEDVDDILDYERSDAPRYAREPRVFTGTCFTCGVAGHSMSQCDIEPEDFYEDDE